METGGGGRFGFGDGRESFMVQRDKKAVRAMSHRHGRSDGGDAFIPDPGSGPARVKDDLAQMLAEELIGSATSGEEQGEEAFEEVVPEEDGGPFLMSPAIREFARGADASNPKDAEPAAFPTAIGGGVG
jgi:hypothetical protein